MRQTFSMISFAITGMLTDFFSKYSTKVNVIIFEKKPKTSRKILQGLLSNTDDSVSLKIINGNRESPWIKKLNSSTIRTFDSVQEFKKLSANIIWQTNPNVRHKHLVCIPDASETDFENIQYGFSIENVNFLVHKLKNRSNSSQVTCLDFKVATPFDSSESTVSPSHRWDGKVQFSIPTNIRIFMVVKCSWFNILPEIKLPRKSLQKFQEFLTFH